MFQVRTVAPKESTQGATGSVDAVGLDIEVINPGNQANGVPNTTVEYILGEGHSDGFSLAADLSGSGGGIDLGGSGNSATAPIAGIVSQTVITTGGGGYGPVSTPTKTTPRLPFPATALTGFVRPPFALAFFLWEATVMGAAGAIVWARRRATEEVLA